jgi:hydrogenase expression/formation protein HypE
MASLSLSVGKLEPKLLKRLIFNRLGVRDPRVLLTPSIGEDATVVDFGEKALIIHSDPITGTVENLGWLAVNVCTNDIATRGVRPLWILTVLLLPEKTRLSQLKRITSQIDHAAKHLGVAVVGGHSEVTCSVKHPIVITTAIGESLGKSYVRTSGAKVGDKIILTKGAAIEGTVILANELRSFLLSKLDTKIIEKARLFIKKTSVVQEALTAVEAAGDQVHAMHDATEGGVAGGLQEIAWASGTGLIAYEEKIPVFPETQAICDVLKIDPLRTISSGTLIIAAETGAAEKIVAALRQNGVPGSVIGKVVERREGQYIIRKNGTKLDLSKPVHEELWKPLRMK